VQVAKAEVLAAAMATAKAMDLMFIVLFFIETL
jgi:hypothetical protein